MTARSLAALLAVLVVLGACGGPSTRKTGPRLTTPKLPPANPEALKEFDAGMRALKLGGPEAGEKASERLLAATRLDDKLWEAWHNLGVLRFDNGDDSEAVDALSKALAINPAHLESRLARAEAYGRMGDVDEAKKDYQVLIRERPTDRLAYARLASLYRRQKKYEDALDTVRAALVEAGASSQLYVELGLIYLRQGRAELAELVLRRALALDEKEPSVYNAIALVLLERGKDQLAFERFDDASNLDPKYADARFNAAAVLLDAGDYPRAKAMLESLIQQAPDDLEAKNALGVALRGIKDYGGAATMWENVVRDAPPRSRVRGDALWNLAVLEADIKMNDASAKRALDRYLQESVRNHPKRKQAEERRKELGQ